MANEPIGSKLMAGIYYTLTVGVGIAMIYKVFPKARGLFRCCLGAINKLNNCVPAVTYREAPLSQVSKRRLQLVRRKTLVLDMDETMITSLKQRDEGGFQYLPETPYDHCFHLSEYHSTYYVYKRPHLDLFLDHVSKWYNLVVFTAAVQSYASPVLDFLENGRHIFQHRYYRQHCIEVHGMRGKFLSTVHKDLANVLLLDNSDLECSFNMGNAVHIKSYRIGSNDEALLSMLPFLDALRFTSDVRSVLNRCTKYESQPSILAKLEYQQLRDEDVRYSDFQG